MCTFIPTITLPTCVRYAYPTHSFHQYVAMIIRLMVNALVAVGATITSYTAFGSMGLLLALIPSARLCVRHEMLVEEAQ